MKPDQRADRYLIIPPALGDALGLHWSIAHDCILHMDGNTFVLIEELIPVLDGVFARQPVPPFGFVLAALHAIKKTESYRRARGATTLARNVGLLISDLCRELPVALVPPDWVDLRMALESRLLIGRPSERQENHDLVLSASTIIQLIGDTLEKIDPATLLARLKTGAPPLHDAVRELSQAPESLLVRFRRLLNLAGHRPRLIGAAHLVPALDAALTIPPRRQSPEVVPQGGYADVTTRGQPERLLLSQFALDTDEFVRRFAENELLFFRPEIPHEPQPSVRMIVLDQGVRTWGHVRLALAGAAMSLLGREGRSIHSTSLVTSSDSKPISLENTTPQELVARLEASDLSRHPANLITVALSRWDTPESPRDVIVLTHPRSLAEPAVVSALNAHYDSDRIFALTVDNSGWSELIEWGDRGPVRMRSFRVDLTAAEQARIATPAPRSETVPASWTGDREPIGFPFRPGIVADPIVFGFDGPGEWLVTASRDGILQAIPTTGEPPEVWPRPYRNGAVLKSVDKILGVMDGVVVCGQMNLPDDSILVTHSQNSVIVQDPIVSAGSTIDDWPISITWHVAVHYDRVNRTVKLHRLARVISGASWFVSMNRRVVGIRTILRNRSPFTSLLDLSTGELSQRTSESDWTILNHGPPINVPFFHRISPDADVPHDTSVCLEDAGLELRRGPDSWPRFMPTRDGKPILKNATIESCQLAFNVLVLSILRDGVREKLVIRGPHPRLVYRLPGLERSGASSLSTDGNLLAYRSRVMDVSIVETTSSALPRTVATNARLHNELIVSLLDSPFNLTIGIGDFIHRFWIESDALQHSLQRGRPPVHDRHGSNLATFYDRSRFPAKAIAQTDTMCAVVDRLGQVLLMTGDRVLFSFVVRRERAAAIGSDGTCWGDVVLLGCPVTPNAAELLARRIASGGGA